jgi:hypothetical protein
MTSRVNDGYKRGRPDVSGQIGIGTDELYIKRVKIVAPSGNSTILRTQTLTDGDGTIALMENIPSVSNTVTLTGNQTITGQKTFAVNPKITAISTPANYVLTLPNTQHGTVALTSDIPTNSTYVDLSTNQSVSGIKTFATNPKLTALTTPSNYTLTLPDTASGTIAKTSDIPTNSTYVDLTTNQTVGGIKTLTSQLRGKAAVVTPATTPTFAFDTATTAGSYYATNGSTYEEVGTAVNGVAREEVGRSLSTGASYFNFRNTDGTLLAGVSATSGAGSGYFSLGSANGSNAFVTNPATVSTNLALPTASGSLLGNGQDVILPSNNFRTTAASGSASVCNYQFIAANHGIRSDGPASIYVCTNGTDRLLINAVANYNFQQSKFSNGDATNPGMTWTSEATANTGWYRIAEDTIGFTVGGVQKLQFDAFGIDSVAYRPLTGTQVRIHPTTNAAAGTCTLLVSPTSGTWTAGGAAQVYFGDANHRITATNGTGMVISDTDGIQLGVNGTKMTAASQWGSFASSTAIGAGSSTSLGTFAITGFSAIPNISLTVMSPPGGPNFWDWVIVTIDQSLSSSTTIALRGTNMGAGPTSGTATIFWKAIA